MIRRPPSSPLFPSTPLFRSPRALPPRPPRRELALGHVLDAGVDGELDAAPLRRRRRHARGEDHLPAPVAVRLDVVRLPADPGIQTALEPLEPLRGHPDAAEHVGREAVAGVEAAALPDRVDALQAEPRDGLGLVRRHLPLESPEALRAGRLVAPGAAR